MIEKTGIIYSENEDLSNSQTIEQAGEQSSITVPNWPRGTDLYVKAYCVESGQTYESSIEHYVEEVDYFYLKNEYQGQNTVTFSWSGTPSGSRTEAYSKDKVNWTRVTADATSVTMEEGEKLYLRGFTNGIYRTQDSVTCSEIYSIGGRIDGTSHNANAGCAYMFRNSTTLIDASAAYFIGTEITNGSCAYMFDGCRNLVNLPDMSGIRKIYDNYFSFAFQNTKATYADLSSLEEVGYRGLMGAFYGSKIETISMDNIKTVGSQGLYQCFISSKLTKGIDLRNITTYNGNQSFKELYRSCSNLYEATYPPTIYDSSTMTDWLRSAGTNVSGTKTVYCPTGVTVPSGNSGVPSGWTRVDY